ncbi:nicotinate phosphoribosyltransferase isoform X2 [Dermacentor albipictus]|uniref:nicotinate phosphoribosyltransferase isoform X2 n=1 Tax=Dermacentor albipictus TaxID=60249 RepID=UPI0031FCD521
MALLTDLYQITMAYAYWKSGKHDDGAVFDLFFRKNPFQGEFTVFAGLEDCIRFLQAFRYSKSDIEYLKTILPASVDPAYYDYLSSLTAEKVKLYAVPEGTVVFPRVPLIRVEGPLAVLQLFETTLLNLVNYASLVTTNAARFRLAAGSSISLLEFGLRRAQGPDGGLSASKYTYLGGFDGTSNVLAGKLFNIPLKGTHAHAFIMSFSCLEDCKLRTLKATGGDEVDFMELCCKWRKELTGLFKTIEDEASSGELAAFISYAVSFPQNFLALVDTYDVLRSGLLNFSAVAMALNDLGYRALGIRIDSGDLAYLSSCAYHFFSELADKYNQEWFRSLAIVASNDINEETIISLNEQVMIQNKIGSARGPRAHSKRDCSRTATSGETAMRDTSHSTRERHSAPGGPADPVSQAAASGLIMPRETIVTQTAEFKASTRRSSERSNQRPRWPPGSKLPRAVTSRQKEAWKSIKHGLTCGHKINSFGIGTHLVTCQKQPALGCVYKLVEVKDLSCIKLSLDIQKVTIPGKKACYRLYGHQGYALLDLMQKMDEPPPEKGKRVLCRHPFQESKRAYVIPDYVEDLCPLWWDHGKIARDLPPLDAIRNRVQESLKTLRPDIKRTLNPTPYKVSVSDNLYMFMHELWLQNAPIGELS